MAAFVAVRRATLTIPGTGPPHDRDRSHLFVILTDPCSKGFCLLVPICSAREKYDATCLLKKGDHSFVADKSFVDYSLMNTFVAKVLEDQVAKAILRPYEMLDEKIFARVCDGIGKSRRSAPIYKNYFAEQTKPKTQPKTKV